MDKDLIAIVAQQSNKCVRAPLTTNVLRVFTVQVNGKELKNGEFSSVLFDLGYDQSPGTVGKCNSLLSYENDTVQRTDLHTGGVSHYSLLQHLPHPSDETI